MIHGQNMMGTSYYECGIERVSGAQRLEKD